MGQGQFAYISRDGGKIVYTRRDMDAGVVGIVFAQGTIRDSKHSMGLRLNKESFQPGDILDLSIDLRAGDTDSVVDASVLPGPYTFYAVLTKQGSDPLVQDNWLSNLAQASL